MGCCQTQSTTISQEYHDQNQSVMMDISQNQFCSMPQSKASLHESTRKERYQELPDSEYQIREVRVEDQTPSLQRSNQPMAYSKPVSSLLSSQQSICIPERKSEYDFNVDRKAFVRQSFIDINIHYFLQDMVGQGGFGRVFRVLHRKTNMIRALKVVAKDKFNQEKLIEEMNLLSQMDHPNIVKLYEVFEDEDSFYLVNEFCSGGEMFDRIKKQRKLSEHNISNAMKQILSAIVYCHKNNIVHRDLKPENIMYDNPGDDAQIKLIDFGASAKLEQQNPLKKRIGTPFYVAPEVLAANYTEKCDIWSLGVMLYLFLCGYPPFLGSNEVEILRKVKKGQYTMDPKDWRYISPMARDLVQKMLTVDPNKRLSAMEAYNHPWIQSNNIQEPLNNDVIQRLGDFQMKNMLKRVIYEYISVQVLTSQEKGNMIKEFNTIDTNGDGMLSKQELYRVYVKIFQGNKIKAHQVVDELFQSMDIDRSGKVDFSEFLAALLETEKKLSQERLEQAFKLFDLDGNGLITKQELQELFGGIVIKEKLWDSMLKECDEDQDGMISQREFFSLLSQKGLDSE